MTGNPRPNAVDLSPILLERAGVRRIKSRLYLIFPHPTFSLWRRLLDLCRYLCFEGGVYP